MHELFAFFAEVDQGENSAEKVIAKIAQIVVSANETIENFIMLHNVDMTQLTTKTSYKQLHEFMASLFRLSKFESYQVFLSLM